MLRVIGCALLLAGAAPLTQAADEATGRALYEGRMPLSAPACVDCHRPSGMGNFEGGLVVPPITGPMLFNALDTDTAHFFARSKRFRVRPAYDDASLARLLRTGIAPDGVTMQPEMPRYAIGKAELRELTAYLRGLSATPAAGIDADTVRIATITTPDADPARRDAMLATLNRFVAQKNGQSRQEVRRAVNATRTQEMAMYKKFRVWQLDHWALRGEPATWRAQLDAWQVRAPVFAVVAGLGGATWAPVDGFCEARRIPCLLPLVDGEVRAAGAFYSLHYHAGLPLDAALAARELKARGIVAFSVHTGRLDDTAAEPPASALADQVRAAFTREGLREQADRAAGAEGFARAEGSASPAGGSGLSAIVSLLAPEAQAAWLRQSRPDALVVWLPATHALGRRELDAVLPLMPRGMVVTPMRTGDELDRALNRARVWAASQKLGGQALDVTASTLQAATVLGEGLAHIDFAFSPEYLLELLEHGLENVIPWSPYPRLAIGPGQRIASKGSWVGSVSDGTVAWRWQSAP
jgi:mono/diheme cytochrome c family protein